MASPTADWERVGDRYYRKVKLYDAVFDQDLELENYIIAGAPYGGAIGMIEPLCCPLSFRLTDASLISGRREATRIQRHAGRQIKHRHLQLRGEANTANQCGCSWLILYDALGRD